MKRKDILRILIYTISFCLTTSCAKKQSKKSFTKATQQDSLDFSFQTVLKYAKGFSVVNHKNYKEIYIFHPITKDTMQCYITTLAKEKLPMYLQECKNIVEIPAKNIACLSSTGVGTVEVLNLREKLVGCGTPEYIWDEKIQKRIKTGKVQEIGRGMGFNVEKIIALSPDLLMQNFMDKTDTDQRLSKSGIKVLYNNSWKETTLLGRAEWLKFMALFFGKERMADSIFNKVEQNYKAVKNLAKTAEKQPSVMYGSDYKGIWYLPQNGTYVAQTLCDANAIFHSAGDGSSSIPKSFEEVYEISHKAEFWFTTQGKVHSMKEFLSSNERYGDFASAKDRKVYSNNKREKPSGGNDYWESGINRPDLLLKDFVKMLHPELLPDYETVYWQHLE